MRRLGFLVLLLLAATASADVRLPPFQLLDEGTAQGQIGELDCAGLGVACTVNGRRGILTVSGGGGGPTVLRVSADVSSTDATNWADVTGLTISVTSGTTYYFACRLTYTTAATTTAVHLSLNGPTVTALDYGVEIATTATARHNSAQTGYNTVVNPATGGGSTRLPAQLHGTIIPSATGTLAIRLKTEVSASAATVKRGSWCEVLT